MGYSIYSNSLDEMVYCGFIYKGEMYLWNDYDCVYYNKDSDESWFYDIPFSTHSTGGNDRFITTSEYYKELNK